MLIEVSMLKNYPATCLNRDDANLPKTVCFGGVERARISSQSLKRSWRKSALFGMALEKVGQTIRLQTRKFPSVVCDKLKNSGISEDFLKVIPGVVKTIVTGTKKEKNKTDDEALSADVKEDDKKDMTKQIMVYSGADIDVFAEVIAEKIKEVDKPKDLSKKETIESIKAMLKERGVRPVTPDIALFGRMVTNDMFHSVDGAMQVAHAFSTNKVVMESDFFVATDDLITGDEFGAGMMDDADFNSCCYYINGTIDVDLFCKNMKEASDYKEVVKTVIPALIETMAFANPSGKQHSFAGNVLPSLVLIEIKDVPKPVTYANAFVKPVSANAKQDLVSASVKRLADYVGKMNSDFDLGVVKRYWFCSGLDDKVVYPEEDGITVNCNSLKELLEGVKTALKDI